MGRPTVEDTSPSRTLVEQPHTSNDGKKTFLDVLEAQPSAKIEAWLDLPRLEED